MKIPFSRPSFGPREAEAVANAVRQHRTVGNGEIGKRVEQKLVALTRSPHALLTPSATQAMDVALYAFGIGPGDEVLMPSFAFVSQANAILARGARPVFCEIDAETLNMCPLDAEARITPRTRMIMPVHYAGVACDLDAFTSLAQRSDLILFEDAAQGIGATHRGRPLGTIGDAGCYSFHETKNVACGEGGCLLVRDDRVADTCEIIREKGTNRHAFLRGDVDRYTWVGPGGSYVLSDVLAALLEVQLERLDDLNLDRMRLWNIYHAGLESLEKEGLVIRPIVPAYANHNAHIYAFRTRTRGLRAHLLTGLKARGIAATFHFQPLHDAPYALARLGPATPLRVTESAAETLIRLPLYDALRTDEAERIVSVILELCAE